MRAGCLGTLRRGFSFFTGGGFALVFFRRRLCLASFGCCSLELLELQLERGAFAPIRSDELPYFSRLGRPRCNLSFSISSA